MPKHLARLSKFGGQHRLTIPKLLVEELGWHDVEYVVLSKVSKDLVYIRRFIDGESLGAHRKEDRPGSD